MLIGILLILTWLILLLRYPAKALPVSLAAAAGLGIVAAIVIWQESQETRQLERLDIQLGYDTQGCPADRPLRVSITNDNQAALLELHWRIAAYAPGDTVNLVDNTYTSARYRGPGQLQSKAAWQDCVPLPALRNGYRPQTLAFRAEHLQGSFSD
ncbi:multidrug transporter [Pseudomonas syringae]|uniref:multidrug transporter n=1 Tax=Pseudomonas syringae TaxID=317 RepID=UPI001F27AF3A|nr:multidrug transporter [Pseudomonas syringae]MCF5223025.1 multidrug transporter [Pseudomonas syringae]MCF5240025.1 multidrug transporter [Pseudomonas syringae]